MRNEMSSFTIRMDKESIIRLDRQAEIRGETRSQYCRNVLLEALDNRLFYTDKDAMIALMTLCREMQAMRENNAKETIANINRWGGILCQKLSSK